MTGKGLSLLILGRSRLGRRRSWTFCTIWQAKWWGIWFIGLPSAAVLVIDPLERLFKFFSGGPR